MTRKIILLIGLGRVLMSPITMSAPVFGALSARIVDPGVLVGLAVIGLCAHLHGFVLNDLIDFKLDRTVPARRANPFITERVSTGEAWLFALLQIPLVVGIYTFLLNGSTQGALILLVSLFLSLIYNYWSKWGPLPKWLPELALALSIGALCLAGALIESQSLSAMSILLCLALSLCLLLLNSVPSGLKDLKTDSRFGAQSFVIWMKARIVDNEYLSIPGRLWLYSFLLQAVYVLLLLLLTRVWDLPLRLTGLVILLVMLATWRLRKTLSAPSVSRMLNDQPLLSGVYNYCALAVILLPIMPAWVAGPTILLALVVLLKPMSLASQMTQTDYGYFDPERYFKEKKDMES